MRILQQFQGQVMQTMLRSIGINKGYNHGYSHKH